MKIFEIGVAKTGTVSLGIAFKILGFTHKGFSEECYLPEPYPNWTKEDSCVSTVSSKKKRNL